MARETNNVIVIDGTRFNLDQLQVGRDAFMNMLTASLKKETEE
jgi:hypothetical protein